MNGSARHQAHDDPGAEVTRKPSRSRRSSTRAAHRQPQRAARDEASRRNAVAERGRRAVVEHEAIASGGSMISAATARRSTPRMRWIDEDAHATSSDQVASARNSSSTCAQLRACRPGTRSGGRSASITTSWCAISSFSPRTMPPMVVPGGSSSSSSARPTTREVRRSPTRDRLDRLGRAAAQRVHAHHRALADVRQQRRQRDLLRRHRDVDACAPSTSSA